MAVTWQSQPNSARLTTTRRRRLASGPASQEAVAPPQPVELRPPATPYYSRLRRRSTGYRVASVDVVTLSDETISRRKSYALFSPYAPLPAIGGDGTGAGAHQAEAEHQNPSVVMDANDNVQEDADAEIPRLLRERTYSVIEPVFVRGPSLQWAQPVRTNNGAWSRQAEKPSSPGQPTSPHLPHLVSIAIPQHRRPSTPEMLDDVQLPPDLDLNDDIFSEDLSAPDKDSLRKRSESITRSTPPTSIDLNSETPPEIKEQRNPKLVTEVTDSLKRLWTRL